jgi:hypothetical protein
MINAIGEATIQQTIRTNHHISENERELSQIKDEQVREQRPVEKTGEGSSTQMDNEQFDRTTSRHSIEDGKIIIERYDKAGRLIKKIPPGYLPLGELA